MVVTERFVASTSITTLAESGNTCLISSSPKWVIGSSATDHMTGNPDIFFHFRSHTASSSVTIADGTTYNIAGAGAVQPISSSTLSSVLYLPSLVFNLIYVSRITRDLNCCISFYTDHCLFQDLMSRNRLFVNDMYPAGFIFMICGSLALWHALQFHLW